MISKLQKLNEEKEAKKLFELLNSNEDEVVCLFVGGCIRDLIAERKIIDIDFATSLTPDQVKEKLSKENYEYDDKFQDYGSIKCKKNNKFFEINTLRQDFAQDGRHSKVSFTKDWKQDALRRDFTINSIYSDLEGRVYDPFNGIKDLEIGKIRFIGDPATRIDEDYLRALRYFRFFIQFSNNNHDEYILKHIEKNLHNIESLSKQRLLDELKKILLTGQAYKIFDDNFSKDLYLSVYRGIKYLTRLEFHRKKRIIHQDIDWVILISLLLIDQTRNFERFVKDFNISNDVKSRLDNLQKQFTFKTSDTVEGIENLRKKVHEFGSQSVTDFIHFQYLINDRYKDDIYFENIEIIKNENPPEFKFDANILLQKGFQKDENLGKAINFLKDRWIKNEYTISDKDIEDAIQLYK